MGTLSLKHSERQQKPSGLLVVLLCWKILDRKMNVCEYFGIGRSLWTIGSVYSVSGGSWLDLLDCWISTRLCTRFFGKTGNWENVCEDCERVVEYILWIVESVIRIRGRLRITMRTWQTFWTAGFLPRARAADRSSGVTGEVLRLPDSDGHHQLLVSRQLRRQLCPLLRRQRPVPSHRSWRHLLRVRGARVPESDDVPRRKVIE